MSTKTTLKRVSLVAVAALGFGLLSVVPSSAVVQSDTLALASATASVANGATATVDVTQTFLGLQSDTVSVTASLVSSPAGNAVVPILVAKVGSTVNGNVPVISGGSQVGTFMDTGSATVYTQATAVYTVTLTTPTVAGTYVVKLTPTRQDAVTPVATAQTWTVTVGAATAATADTTSTAYKGVGVVAGTSVTDLVAVNVAMATAATAAANIAVTPLLASAASSVALTASISGPGNISIGSLGAVAVGRTQTESAASSATRYVNVWSDGTAGISTITISQGTTVLATKTVTFYGAIATVTTTLVNSVLAVGSTGANIGAITAVAKDTGGNVVPVGNLYATSDVVGAVSNSYSVAAIGGTTAGVATFTLTGVAAGTANITVGTGSSAAATSNIVGAVQAVRVGTTATAVALTFDKASYSLGESATLTVTLTDATGKAVPNGAYANIFTAQLTSTFALGGVALPTGTITTTGSLGTATFAVSMPTFAADVVVSGTGGTALAAAQAALKVSSDTISIANPAADAATDAANAATDAANYAADAADAATTAAEEATAAAQDAADAAKAAQDSADAATAAVVDLGLKVTGLIASLRAQLTALTNLIVQIQSQQAKTAAAIAKLPKK